MMKKFTKEEINHFKALNFPWIGTRIITPDHISFYDNMYLNRWVINKDTEDGFTIFSLERRKRHGKKYWSIGDEYSILNLLLAVEMILWTEAIDKTPVLKSIPMDYILETPERLHLKETAIPFLLTLVPQKLRERN